jgi:hypothetical protein
MPLSAAAIRFPYERILLPRTKLAYVHLRNLLTDAKRDRTARVFGYVAIWLPEEFLLLYLQEGEPVNATCFEGEGYQAIPISEAIARVPTEPELGEVCFHEADDEQLACMFTAQLALPEAWPAELDPGNPKVLFPYLMSTTFDGMVQIIVDGAVSFLILRDGKVERGYLSDGLKGPLADRVKRLFASNSAKAPLKVERWPVPPPLPVQASPSMVKIYRELSKQLIQKLVVGGGDSVSEIAEFARLLMLPHHRCLASFTALGEPVKDPIVDADTLTTAMRAWVTEILWASVGLEISTPEALLGELMRERRHMLQSAGFFDGMPWKPKW